MWKTTLSNLFSKISRFSYACSAGVSSQFLFLIVFHVNGGWLCANNFLVTILSLLFVFTGFVVVSLVSHLTSVVSGVVFVLSVDSLHNFPHLN
jgi:hypothetical protein